ncbi:MAG: nucleotidyltransferase domain-containing protein [Syntrophorhabdaceae bacterium]
MGPLTGFEIQNKIDADSLILWKICKISDRIGIRTAGMRYMRLDRHVEGFARLSPSILREFLTYSVMGLADDERVIEERCKALNRDIVAISRRKYDLARQMAQETLEEFECSGNVSTEVCFIIAGDIVYNMAHDVPRPEPSTGKLVRGSDIDLVIVVPDHFSEDHIKLLDTIVYNKKYRMLKNPDINEEIDYTIKKLDKIRQQASFDDFRKMVAMKILAEGKLLYGSEEIYGSVDNILNGNIIRDTLSGLERHAFTLRNNAEESILYDLLDRETIRRLHLFYPTEEFEEFE